MSRNRAGSRLPHEIAGIDVPQDGHQAALRPTCQSARLLDGTGLADRMALSPWATASDRPGPESRGSRPHA